MRFSPVIVAEMSGENRRLAAWLALAALFLLHNDLWLWDIGRLALGLPAGLLYHLGYCFAAALLMALLVSLDRPPSRAEGGQETREGAAARRDS